MMSAPLRRPALFLDRDGVINENRADYVRRWSDLDIYPQALAALRRARDLPHKIVVVTNQSMVGRGLATANTAREINARLVAAVAAAGGRIDAVFVCPHHPEAGCDCRKPRPGLLRQAVAELDLDLAHSLLIGDALTDLQAGRAAGVGRVALVRTGRGAAQATLPLARRLAPFPIFNSLSHALAHLLPLPNCPREQLVER